MAKIATFNSKCASCGRVFASPFLGDFAYGDFILTGMRGTVHSHLAAIGNEVWDYVKSTVSDTDVDTFQELVARLADPVDGQTLTIANVCPFCQSNDLTCWTRDRVGFVELPSATFNAFLALSDDQRKKRMHELIIELGR